jgi:hypothetical protein
MGTLADWKEGFAAPYAALATKRQDQVTRGGHISVTQGCDNTLFL